MMSRSIVNIVCVLIALLSLVSAQQTCVVTTYGNSNPNHCSAGSSSSQTLNTTECTAITLTNLPYNVNYMKIFSNDNKNAQMFFYSDSGCATLKYAQTITLNQCLDIYHVTCTSSTAQPTIPTIPSSYGAVGTCAESMCEECSTQYIPAGTCLQSNPASSTVKSVQGYCTASNAYNWEFTDTGCSTVFQATQVPAGPANGTCTKASAPTLTTVYQYVACSQAAITASGTPRTFPIANSIQLKTYCTDSSTCNTNCFIASIPEGQCSPYSSTGSTANSAAIYCNPAGTTYTDLLFTDSACMNFAEFGYTQPTISTSCTAGSQLTCPGASNGFNKFGTAQTVPNFLSLSVYSDTECDADLFSYTELFQIGAGCIATTSSASYNATVSGTTMTLNFWNNNVCSGNATTHLSSTSASTCIADPNMGSSGYILGDTIWAGASNLITSSSTGTNNNSPTPSPTNSTSTGTNNGNSATSQASLSQFFTFLLIVISAVLSVLAL